MACIDNTDYFPDHAKVSSDMAYDILKNLKFDNNTIKKVKTLILYHDYRELVTERDVRRFLSKVGRDTFNDYLSVRLCNIKAQKLEHLDNRERQIKILLKTAKKTTLYNIERFSH